MSRQQVDHARAPSVFCQLSIDDALTILNVPLGLFVTLGPCAHARLPNVDGVSATSVLITDRREWAAR